MFKTNRKAKRLTAMILVFTMMFANMFTVVQYAASGLGKQNSENTNKNVEYDAVFIINEEEKGYEYSADMKEENLGIKLSLKVKNAGYLKNANISLESENGLNFDIGEFEESDLVQTIEGNKIKLNQINSGDALDLLLPIFYKDSDSIGNLSKEISVKLSGTYLDNSGDENRISEEVKLRLTWNTNSELSISSEVTKYIPYSSENKTGIIIQTSIKMDMPENGNLVGKEELKIEALDLEGLSLDKVTVLRNNEEEFSQDDWNYDEDSNLIRINVENKETKDFEKEEFLVTYIFSGKDQESLPITLNSKISCTVKMFGSNEEIKSEKEELYTVSEKVGEIVTVSSEFSEEILSKGNILANKYNAQKEYTTNYEINHKINISSKDLIEKIAITDIDENFVIGDDSSYSTVNTSKYKQVKVSKDNFEEILGTDGKISINSNGIEVASITSSSQIDEENNYFTEITGDVSRITINTSSPILEGNLNIKVQKEIRDTEYSISDIKAWNLISYNSQGSIYLSGNVQNNVSESQTTLNLENTKTDANISINKSSLGTIVNNENVELKVSLNNDELGTDFYKNPSFEIILPKYIEEITLKNVAIANSENNFEISSATATAEDGNIVIRVSLNGTQTKYPLNNLTDGTNIIINTNMMLNLLTPSIEDKIIMNYINEEASTYSEDSDGIGVSIAKISYTAPTGVISVNSVSNYNSSNTKITSVEQGEVTDKIEIYDEEKIATMDILVMNNNQNICKDVKILGRIPFKGNKDVKTGEDLGTTVDTTLVGPISENEENKADVTIYYSENEEATEDLENENNGWTTDVADFSKIKSYLIVTNNYEMSPSDILRFSYEYKIPANLEHNNDIYGSFETLYNNVTEIAETEEVSIPNLVGLTTGEGPNLSVQTEVNVGNNESVKEYEKVKYTAVVENTGKEVATDVVVETKLPEGTTLVEYQEQGSIFEEKGWKYIDGKENKVEIDAINPGESKTIEFFVEVNKLSEDKNDMEISWQTFITAKDLAKTLESEIITNPIERATVIVEENTETIAEVVKENDTITYKIAVKNTSDSDLENIKIEKDLPSLLKYSENYVQEFDENLNLVKQTSGCDYDIDSRKVTWTIDNLKKGYTKYVVLVAVAGDLSENVYEEKIVTNSKIIVNSESYYTGEISETLAKPKLVVTQTSDKTDSYIKEGEEINYTFIVKNEGIVSANQVQVTDNLPSEVKITSLNYEIDGIEMSRTVSRNEDAIVYASIAPESELSINVSAVAENIEEAEKTISNVGTVEALNTNSITTNKITSTIEKVATVSSDADDNDVVNGESTTSSTQSQSDAVYKITGTAWLDSNQNGARDENDAGVEGLEVGVVNTETGKTIRTIATSSSGEYSFSNLSNGSYYLVFYYNASRYGLTDYKKEGVADNLNSDVISSQVEENGEKINVAVTDTITISNGSVSNVNIGLIAASIFDLSLDKTISKITVQNKDGTTKYDFDNLTLAKIDIPAKYLSDTKVLVEYKLTVKNEGDVEGYAKKIVDYMPGGMDFSTELNPSWYEGSDGNIYNEELSNTALVAGEEKTITLILSKEMTEDNTGIVNNTAEISESYNKAGIADKDSTPGNKAQNEDDFGKADAILSVKTGDTLIYISTIVIIAILSIVLLVVIRVNRFRIKWFFEKKGVN